MINAVFSFRSIYIVTTLLGNVMVQALHFGVVSQQIQALTVRFPQELHPRSEEQSVCTILGIFSTHSAQEHTEKKRKLLLAFSFLLMASDLDLS